MVNQNENGNLDMYDTIQPADVVESCPIEGYENTIVYGTYSLREMNEIGRACHQGTIGMGEIKNQQYNPVQVLECPYYGIFDLQWSTQSVQNRSEPVLAAATTIGTLDLFILNGQKLQRWMSSTKHEDETTMYTCIDWNNRRYYDPSPSLGVSQSNGRLSTWRIEEDGLTCLNRWDAHTQYGAPSEVWSTAFDSFNASLLFSGADDGILKMWDLREDSKSGRALYQKRNAHEMGICCIRSHPSCEHVFATGSYDEYIHLWDKRLMESPINSYKTDGGVWTLKWNPENPSADGSTLITACMHGGCEIVEVNFSNELQTEKENAKTTMKRVQQYKGHKSIAYGIDYWYDRQNLKSPKIFFSCSFYDHSLHIWKI